MNERKLQEQMMIGISEDYREWSKWKDDSLQSPEESVGPVSNRLDAADGDLEKKRGTQRSASATEGSQKKKQ